MIFVVVLLVFGPNKLPDLGRQVGKGVAELRKFQQTLKRDLDEVFAEDHSDAATPAPTLPAKAVDDQVTGETTPGDPTPTPQSPAPADAGSRDAGCRDAGAAASQPGFRDPRATASAPASPATVIAGTVIAGTVGARRTGRRGRAVIRGSTGRLHAGRPDAERPPVPRQKNDGRMTVVEHLAELRTRIIISIVAVTVGAVFCYVVAPEIIQFFLTYYKDANRTATATGSSSPDPSTPSSTRIKVATYGGIVSRAPGAALAAVAVHHPGPQPAGEALRDPVRGLVHRPVRDWVASWRC